MYMPSFAIAFNAINICIGVVMTLCPIAYDGNVVPSQRP